MHKSNQCLLCWLEILAVTALLLVPQRCFAITSLPLQAICHVRGPKSRLAETITSASVSEIDYIRIGRLSDDKRSRGK